MTLAVSCMYNPLMSDIDVRGTSPEEVIRDIENKTRLSRENKYDFHIALKDVDFDINEPQIKILNNSN